MKKSPTRLVRSVFGWLVIAVLAALVVVVVVIPPLGGARVLTVLTGSMTPTVPAGSLIAVRPIDPALLQVGDIITFATQDEATLQVDLVTHRIVSVDDSGEYRTFVTKGDANPGDDIDPVLAPNVRGELWYHVPYLGQGRDLLSTGPALLYVGAGLLLLVAGWQLFGGRRSGEQEPSGGPDTEDTTPLARVRR